MTAKKHILPVARNKIAYRNYFIANEIEAGMVLRGTEVKAMRNGRVNLKDSYARIQEGEVYVHQMHIGEYRHAGNSNHASRRVRKLLLHRYEIKQLYAKVNEKGANLIPLEVYFKNGHAKIKLGVAKGKKKYDKKETIKRRDEKRDLERQMKRSTVKVKF